MEYIFHKKFSRKKNIYSVLLLVIFNTGSSFAYTGWCKARGGTVSYPYNFSNITITDQSMNTSGRVLNSIFHWKQSGTSNLDCDCDPTTEIRGSSTYYHTETNLPYGHSDSVNNFFKINDYLEAATSIYIGGTREVYVPTPWKNESNNYPIGTGNFKCIGSVPDTRNDTSTGSEGNLSLYITKPFVGSTFIESVKIVDIYASEVSGSFGGTPIASVSINGTITVPQNCEINAGQIITVDFGKIWSGDFTTKGQKPDGYVAKNIKASMKCNNINAYTNLTIRFQSEISNDYPDAIKTNNPDIGVEIIDDNGHLVLPNTGLIPFNIDDKYEASVTFKAQPVSTTGNPPSAGQFQAQAYIRVDFA